MAPSQQIVALAVAVGLCLVMALLGSLLTGNQLRGWFADLRTPRWQLPLWAFIGVGIVVYVLDAVIAYRLLTVLHDTAARVVALTALVVVMLYNELWNYAFFGLRSTFAGFLGVLAFLAPLAVLQVALTVYDRPSAALLLLYVLWVVGYDVPWTYTLWRLNADPRR
jgi:translocator protein